LPKTQQRIQAVTRQPEMWKFFCRPNILASVFVSGFLFFTLLFFTTFWGLWLSQDFGFSALEIGVIGTSIGIAEFGGLLLAGLIIDRIGKRRGSLISMFVGALIFAFIPIFQQNIIVIRIMLILLAFALEFAVTASIPLFAEQAPEARATVFSFTTLGSTLGFGFAPPLATMLWASGGLFPVIIAGTISSLVTFYLVLRFLHDRSDSG
jgi:predicted MFS family arabinose efflux permease